MLMFSLFFCSLLYFVIQTKYIESYSQLLGRESQNYEHFYSFYLASFISPSKMSAVCYHCMHYIIKA